MYIFLDIDGVLNTEKDWNHLYTLQENNINALCRDYPNARVILISSWKNGFISRKNRSNSEPIKRLESTLSNGVTIVGKVPNKNVKRNVIIKQYVQEHPGIQEYIIIDDDITEYDTGYIGNPHLKIINSKQGYI